MLLCICERRERIPVGSSCHELFVRCVKWNIIALLVEIFGHTHTWPFYLYFLPPLPVLTLPQPVTRMIPQESLKIRLSTGMWQWQTDTTTQKKTWRTVSVNFKSSRIPPLFAAIINDQSLRPQMFVSSYRVDFKSLLVPDWCGTCFLKIAGG